MTSRTICADCRWWGREREHDLDQPYGTCRARPPRYVKGEIFNLNRTDSEEHVSVSKAKWPWSAFDDWCGAAEPR